MNKFHQIKVSQARDMSLYGVIRSHGVTGILILLFLSSCGYTMQGRHDLPFETVALGRIENRTQEPKLQDKLDRALAETLMEYGMTVSPSAMYAVDAEITRYELRIISEKGLAASEYEVIVYASFRLADRAKGTTRSFGTLRNPFITTFNATVRLDDVLAQKDAATIRAVKDLSEEFTRRLVYSNLGKKDIQQIQENLP